MSPEKFFDYLEGKLPPPERERLERALIHDPELQRQFVAARQIHRGMQRPADETAATDPGRLARATARGGFCGPRAMNVALGLIYIFREPNRRPKCKRRGRGAPPPIAKFAREIGRRGLFAANHRDGECS